MLVPLTNVPRDYAWGSRTLLAALEGRAPSDRPEAEVWFGDHPGAPAQVGDGTGRTLDRWLADEHRERLPYLLKLLAAAAPLSIQAHPSKRQAELGFAREEAAGVDRDAASRNYKDDNHKPELIVALADGFRALAGLRDAAATVRLFEAVGGGPGASALRARLADDDAFATLVPWLLSGDSADAVAALLGEIGAAESDEFAGELALGRDLAAAFPGDPGVVVALLMNLVTLRRGEGVFVPAGVLHAYVGGIGVELMAASDNVLRGGLTPKHVDVAELAAVLDAAPGPVPVLLPEPVPGARGDVGTYPTPVADFALTRVRSGTGDAVLPLRGTAIAVAVSGSLVVTGASGALAELQPGQAVLAAEEAHLSFSGAGEAFVAQPGGGSHGS